MKLTHHESNWSSFVRYGRAAFCATLLWAGMSAVTQANHHGSWYVPAGHGGHHHSQPTPPTTTPHTPTSTVPEIDAGAAVGGLALLLGMVMLLRDRALAR